MIREIKTAAMRETEVNETVKNFLRGGKSDGIVRDAEIENHARFSAAVPPRPDFLQPFLRLRIIMGAPGSGSAE